jgi:hypothetical protein
MRIDRGNPSTQRKPAPVLSCPPQIPHDDLGSNRGRRGGNLATNRLSCGTARMVRWLINSELEKIEVLFGNFPGKRGKLRKTAENSRCHGLDSNPASPEYKSRALPLHAPIRFSVHIVHLFFMRGVGCLLCQCQNIKIKYPSD